MVRRFRAGVPKQTKVTPTQTIAFQELEQQVGDPVIQNRIEDIKEQIRIKSAQVDRQREGGGRADPNLINQIAGLNSDLTTLRKAQQSGETAGSVQRRIQFAQQSREQQLAESQTAGERGISVTELRQETATKQAQAEQLRRAEAQGLTPVFQDGNLVGFEDEVRQQSIPVETAVQSIGKTRLERAGFTVTEIKKEIREQQRETVPTGVVSRAREDVPLPKPQEIFASPIKTISEQVVPRASFFLTEQRSKLATKRSRAGGVLGIRETAFALGIGSGISVVGTVGALTSPIETIKNIPSGVVQGAKFVRSGALSQTLITQPAISTGFIATEVGTAFVGGKALSNVLKGTGAGKVPAPESVKIISFESMEGSKTIARIGFETEGGRIGTIVTQNVKDPQGIVRTFGAGEIFEPKFRIGGELKKVNLQSFVGEIASKSRKVDTLQTIEKIDLKIPVATDTSLGSIALPNVVVEDFFKVSKTGRAEQIAGVGRVSLAPGEKFSRAGALVDTRGQLRLFDTGIKGIKQVEFESRATAIKMEFPKTKFITGTTESKLGTAGFTGFAFELPKPKSTGKGINIIKPSGKGKAFQILTPEQISTIQTQADAMAIATQTAKATPTIKTPSIRATPTPKLKLDTKQTITTIQPQAVKPVTRQTTITKIMQGVETRQLQIPATSQALKQRQLQITRLQTRTIQTPAVKQALKQRQLQITKQVSLTGLTPLVPIPPTKTPFIPLLPPPSKRKPSRQPNLFGVSKLTRGKFQTIGAGLSLGKALDIGQEFKTFKITPLQIGGAKGIRTPKGFTQGLGLTFRRKKKKKRKVKGGKK
jgi:hypothetical protein